MCVLFIIPALAVSGLPIYVTTCNSNSQFQQWTISGSSILAYNQYCLDIPNCDTTAGDAEVQVFPCGSALCSGKNQMWDIQSDGSITTELDGLCLDLNVQDGKVQTWTCTNGTNQHWIISGNSIKNAATGQCISVAVGDPYSNPIFDRDYPDPTVIQGGNGLYYAYSTQSAGCHICASQSTNLVNWTDTTDALPQGNSWASGNYWAPDVSFHNGTYLLFFISLSY